MPTTFFIERRRRDALVDAIRGKGVEVDVASAGDARILTCRLGRASLRGRIGRASTDGGGDALRDYAVVVLVANPVTALLRRRAVSRLREAIAAACAPFVIAEDEVIGRAGAADAAGDAEN
jgi:hypothetical protein